MIENIYDINGAYELFKSYNGLANGSNCIFYATFEKELTTGDIAQAAVIFGAAMVLGGGTAVLPGSKFYPAYLINVTDYGVGLIALTRDEFTTQCPINKMKIVPNSYGFISHKDIKNMSSKKNPLCLDPSIRFVTIETNDGFKISFRVKMTNEYLTYHEKNFADFMNRYEIDDKENNKKFIKKIIIALLAVAAIIAIIGVIAESNNNNDSTIKKVPTVDTSKIKVNTYKP